MNNTVTQVGEASSSRTVTLPVTVLVAVMSALVGGAGGTATGYQAASTRDYRLDRLESEVQTVKADVRTIRDSLTVTMADHWTRADHDRWVDRELPRIIQTECQR